jgi:hypothetical protein
LIGFCGWIYGDRLWSGGRLIVWVLRVGEVPVAEVIVIDSGNSVAASGTKGVFAVEVY